jgi:polyvinyl alcohol dehydrogenase (cytochrome)
MCALPIPIMWIGAGSFSGGLSSFISITCAAGSIWARAGCGATLKNTDAVTIAKNRGREWYVLEIMARVSLVLPVAIGCLLLASAAPAQTPPKFDPQQYFQEHCGACHQLRGATRAPSAAALRALTPEAIYEAITNGSMKQQAAGLKDTERTAIAESLTEQQMGLGAVADAKAMTNHCSGNPPLAAATVESGYGFDLANTRFRTTQAAGIGIGNLTNLKLKWAFGVPGVAQMSGQPTVADGRLFFGSQSGYVYALNASTGCVYWSFRAAGTVRTAPVFDASAGRARIWVGDMKGFAYAIDAQTGQQIWKVSLDPHVSARITGAPVLHGGVLYVPVASFEEVLAPSPAYECCTFRGSVAALDASTGRKLWQTYTIQETPHPTKKNSAGTQLWGPAGGGVWGTPVIDAKRGALYIGTGDAYTGPAAATTDAIMALDLKTGAVLWTAQDLPNDAWILGCDGPKNENCPNPLGPDYDFGAATILRELPSGKRVLLAAQKSGVVWGHDVDNKGALLWKTKVNDKTPGPVGEIVWGGAADQSSVYYGLASGGVVALDIATGRKKWLSPFNDSGPHAGSPGAVTAISGVVFAGGLDGLLRAFATEDGRVLWQYDAKRAVETVNGVNGKGGSLGAPGPVLANGILYVESGYIGVVNGQPGNLLLAFTASTH